MADRLHMKIHNFGIYKKNGKRAVLQLDFPGESIHLIERGQIKKVYTFDELQHYDSEDGLHIVFRFLDSDLELHAGNIEEKFTICRLTSLILDKDGDKDVAASSPGLQDSGVQTLRPSALEVNKIIKEGILEKKGNTTITTWNKRRLKVTPGEFSYYKPGEKHALNIIQIREGICTVKKVKQNGFDVTVKKRAYQFRLLHDQMVTDRESEREEWIEAFHEAMASKRNTYMVLSSPSDPETPRNNFTVFDFSPSSTDVALPSIDEKIERRKASIIEERYDSQSQGGTRSVHLSYIEKTTPLDPLPTASRPKPPSFRHGAPVCADLTIRRNITKPGSRDNERHGSTTEDVEAEPESDYPEERHTYPPIPKDKNSRISPTSDSKGFVNMSSSCPTTTKPDISYSCPTTTKPDIPYPRETTTKPEIPNSFKSPPGNKTGDDKYSDRVLPVSPPTVPSPGIPPPAPPLKISKSGVKLAFVPRMKLKQVHWSKVQQMALPGTLWDGVHDVTSLLDRQLLEEMFALQENETAIYHAEASLQKTKQILLDSKRAQNLCIMFNGPKPDTVKKLQLALSSMSETEDLPVEKLNTLRRYQPTADDIEMYRVYRDTRQDLHPVDRFMVDLCDVPALDIRLDLVVTILDFPNQFEELSEAVDELLRACEELLNNSSLASVLEYLLAIGNYMNAISNSGLGIHGFLITSLDKILDIKSRDHHYTLIHFLVQQIFSSNPQLLDWTSGVTHVQKCADLSIKAMGAEVDVLQNGLQKIKKNLKSLRHVLSSSSSKREKKYLLEVQNFITEYEKKLKTLNKQCTDLDWSYRSILSYFGESQTKTSNILFSSISLFADRFQAARENL